MAATLATRLDAERAARIGIPHRPNEHWYMRLYDAIDRITRVLEPYYFPTRAEKLKGAPNVSRGRIMTGEAFRRDRSSLGHRPGVTGWQDRVDCCDRLSKHPHRAARTRAL